MKNFEYKKRAAIIGIIIGIMIFLSSCSGSSSYQLHNKDGSLNMQYYNDMQTYFNNHPEKRP